MTSTAFAKPPQVRLVDAEGTPRLQLRRRANTGKPAVLFIHGATFPTALSIGYRFGDGGSWEDCLYAEGYDVWALDFEGFGGSARPAAFDAAPDASPIPLRSFEAAQQVARAVALVRKHSGTDKVALLAHSWGTIPAARFATDHAAFVSTLVMFAPIFRRMPHGTPVTIPGAPTLQTPALPAWRWLTVADQLARFTHDTPKDHASVLAEPMLDHWGPAWLATDPANATHSPPAVRVPTGPQADIMATWTGADLYDPAGLTIPTAIIRGEWDSLSTEADAATFKARATKTAVTEVVIPHSGHLAQLEVNRAQLWKASAELLRPSR